MIKNITGKSELSYPNTVENLELNSNHQSVSHVLEYAIQIFSKDKHVYVHVKETEESSNFHQNKPHPSYLQKKPEFSDKMYL